MSDGTMTALAPPTGAAVRKVGVLLVNLGSPDAPGFWPVRRYLKEFLSDPRVIETPRLVWWPILNGVILTRRPSRSAKLYRAVWDARTNEPPLKAVTKAQATRLAARLAPRGIAVDWAMRYRNPSIQEALDRLGAQGCDAILAIPLYPQYSGTTTASVCDALFAALSRRRVVPALRVAAPYYATAAYIDALNRSLQAELARLDFAPDAILASFHGIPQSYVEKGDPYLAQCRTTFDLLRAASGWPDDRFLMSFQSRVGPARWLGPYTDETVRDLARRGVKKLAVVTPGFAADCLETIEEIGVENRRYFLESGGENYAAMPCLNDSEPGLHLLEDIVARESAGWL